MKNRASVKQPTDPRRSATRLRSASGALLAAALLGAGAASAQGMRAPSDRWAFELTPYLWATAMKGDVQVGSLPNVNVDVSFSDILDVLDFGLMGAFEARKGRWGLLLDAIYIKASAGATASRTGPGPIGATATASANLEIKQGMLAGALAYRVSDGPTALDLIGGLRYNTIDATADIAGSFFAQTASASRSGDVDWVDPYVGLRVQTPLAERWRLTAYADVGGFGAGSEITWQGALGVDYDFTKTVSAKFGYRYMKIDYDKSGVLYDMDNSGLYLGIGIRF